MGFARGSSSLPFGIFSCSFIFARCTLWACCCRLAFRSSSFRAEMVLDFTPRSSPPWVRLGFPLRFVCPPPSCDRKMSLMFSCPSLLPPSFLDDPIPEADRKEMDLFPWLLGHIHPLERSDAHLELGWRVWRMEHWPAGRKRWLERIALEGKGKKKGKGR
ncbi:MAG: hypothetical protein D6812_14640 [Deltaproteobacteria bacterium]|nr:MAG: hypothetical protein D6812_14640 [Deltaproteobacteria bacterium]